MKKRMVNAIYCGGGLFNIADQLHNLMMEKYLLELNWGYKITIPQKEAKQFIKKGRLDLFAVCLNCATQAASHKIVLLNLDGPDADGGTSLEGGIAVYRKVIENYSVKDGRPIVIGYRTDIRTDAGRELGVNGMFSQLVDKIVYCPAGGMTSFEEVDRFYVALVGKIGEAIQEVIEKD